MMISRLNKIRAINSENCITIILNTSRTMPDSDKDKIVLKNQIKEVEERLESLTDKRVAKTLLERIGSLVKSIDFRQNLDSLTLFVNEDIAEFIRMPIKVQNRVIIGDTFATRDMVRALHSNMDYFILVLSQQKVRMIETLNDEFLDELGNPFPIENTTLHSTSRSDTAVGRRQTNFVNEFFNRVDKQVNTIRKEEPLPVLICSTEENYHDYLNIADEKETVLPIFLNGNRLDDKAHAIAKDAWEIVQPYIREKNKDRKAELSKAIGSGKFLSELNDIWKAIQEVRVKTLFIEKGLFQPVIIDNNEITTVSEEQRGNKNYIDDIYDEMIEQNMSFGGDAVFLPKGEINEFDGFAAILRY